MDDGTTIDSSEEFYRNGALKGELYVLAQDVYQIELLANLDQVPTTGFPVSSFAILP